MLCKNLKKPHTPYSPRTKAIITEEKQFLFSLGELRLLT
jgi:hypothetical protein